MCEIPSCIPGRETHMHGLRDQLKGLQYCKSRANMICRYVKKIIVLFCPHVCLVDIISGNATSPRCLGMLKVGLQKRRRMFTVLFARKIFCFSLSYTDKDAVHHRQQGRMCLHRRHSCEEPRTVLFTHVSRLPKTKFSELSHQRESASYSYPSSPTHPTPTLSYYVR